ncbi:MAG: radical SAM protein [Candidatus Aminicenantes bacterium]|nr:radical SAM protein [Candidatus Aminicenantes bacterium]MCK4760147.1 radical SAM protein [Candidatus Aminicenantes bacterium]
MLRYMNTYDFPPYRPPNEAESALIRITRGCPWNRCTFCFMYKDIRFETKPLEEVRKDVNTARQIYKAADSIFLGDSDNLTHKELPEIVKHIRKTFPEAKRITAYARAKTIIKRKMGFLTDVRKAGLDRLHIGLESGDEVVLDWLCKGAKPEEMVEAGLRARQAGFEVSFYVLSGAGGRNRWKEHAINSARVLNAAKPDFIRLRTLTLKKGTPLKKKLESGEFEITPPLERLKEVRLFVENLTVNKCYLASDHVTNYLWAGDTAVYRGITGDLPEDKKTMLQMVDKAIEFVESTEEEVKDSNRLYEEGYFTAL